MRQQLTLSVVGLIALYRFGGSVPTCGIDTTLDIKDSCYGDSVERYSLSNLTPDRRIGGWKVNLNAGLICDMNR